VSRLTIEKGEERERGERGEGERDWESEGEESTLWDHNLLSDKH
jgi:hypothetical protein